MAVNVKTSSNTINVRVGQTDAVKVLSSAAGGATFSETAKNVIGGIASVTQLNVSGVTTLGITSITDTLYVAGITTVAALGGITTTGGDLFIGGTLNTNDLSVAGVATFGTTSVVIDGDNDLINVGAALTLGSAEGVLTPTLLVSGISTLGVSTFTGDVSFGSNALFGDNDKILLGDDNDLELYHQSSTDQSIILSSKKISLMSGIGIEIEDETGKQLADFTKGGASRLFYNANGDATDLKFQTTGLGITVFGNTETQTLNVTGLSTFAGIVTTTGDMYVGGDLYVLDDLILDEITTRNLNITGLSTFVGNAQFDSNVNIGGTLTYEDVTNVDSIGIVTAGKGFRATTGGLVVTAGVSTFGAIATFTEYVYANKTVSTEQGFRAIAGGLIVTAGIATFGAIATFTSDAFVDGTLTAGLIDGGSY